MPNLEKDAAADIRALRDKALDLRESVNSSRARLRAQSLAMARLREELASLRALAAQGGAPDAVPTPPARHRAGPRTLLPYAAILGVAVAIHLRSLPPPAADRAIGRGSAASSESVRKAADADDDGASALMLAREWMLPGSDLPLGERLGPVAEPPGAIPAWTAERTGERSYRVRVRLDAEQPPAEFDVDLSARSVEPTAETENLLAPRLVSQR